MAKAKSKKGCGLNPICHIERAMAKVRRSKNRANVMVDEAVEGKKSPKDKYMGD